MYLKSVSLQNIRCFSEFNMTFRDGEEAGWHVLIGDNGSGKSAVLKAIALNLVQLKEIPSIRTKTDLWVSFDNIFCKIITEILDKNTSKKHLYEIHININKETRHFQSYMTLQTDNYPTTFFSLAYGPYRRFSGGTDAKDLGNATRAARHFSVFGEDVSLKSGLEWLLELDRKRLKEQEIQSFSGSFLAEEPTMGYNKASAAQIFEWVKTFINTSDLLPNEAKFVGVDIDDELVFEDGNKVKVKIAEMSDGYRSMLALLFDMLRWMVEVCDANEVFAAVREGKGFIPVEGVILIDEIDAHLHPTWQTRIGSWFRQYFPNIQFIVTTHSPLICRGCETGGTIWQLPTPGTGEREREITGVEKNRLIYGNILDAYGTEAFGKTPVRSEKSEEMYARLGRLNIKAALGKISEEEEQERQHLQTILSTDAPTGF